jgi:hypothetical protein
MHRLPPNVTVSKTDRDRMFTWFLEQAPRLILEDCSPESVAAQIAAALAFPCTVEVLDQFRRQITLTWACCPLPKPDEQRTPFYGFAAVLTALLWVFTRSYPLDPCYINLGEEVKEE